MRGQCGRLGLLILVLFAEPVSGQNLLPPAPAETAVVGGTTCRPDYWMVTSRTCSQSGRLCCRLGYMHRTGNQMQWSNATGLQQWLRPGVPICVVVHGSQVDWQTAAALAAHTYGWVRNAASRQSIQFIFFSWPSDRLYFPLPALNLGCFLPQVAARHGVYLAQFLDKLPKESPVTILGHSHGARLTVAALHLMGGGEVDGHRIGYCCGGRRIRAIFAAAAFDHDRLNPDDEFGRALYATECVLNLRNPRDPALGIYTIRKLAICSRALGCIGITRGDRRALGVYQHKYKEYNVASIIGCRHRLVHYIASPCLARQLVPWFYFTDSTPQVR